MEKRPRVRVAIVVVHDGKILLVEHTKEERKYWLLPGGGLEWGEGLKEALSREVEEETGLEVEVGDLLFVSETLAPGGQRHVIHLVFEGELQGGEINVPQEERITDVGWVPLERIEDLTLHPPMQQALNSYRLEGLANKERVFLGNLWVD